MRPMVTFVLVLALAFVGLLAPVLGQPNQGVPNEDFHVIRSIEPEFGNASISGVRTKISDDGKTATMTVGACGRVSLSGLPAKEGQINLRFDTEHPAEISGVRLPQRYRPSPAFATVDGEGVFGPAYPHHVQKSEQMYFSLSSEFKVGAMFDFAITFRCGESQVEHSLIVEGIMRLVARDKEQ